MPGTTTGELKRRVQGRGQTGSEIWFLEPEEECGGRAKGRDEMQKEFQKLKLCLEFNVSEVFTQLRPFV